MKVSICLTVYNEEKSVEALIDSLINQSKKPQEIVIVDGGSSDKTVQIIRHLQKKDKRIKLLVKKCTRAEGRNLSVELSKNEIIAITDGDCIPDKNWLEKITAPFRHKEIDMVAGFYRMIAGNHKQKALSYFLAVTPKRFDEKFLPSTRSIAFRRGLWEKVGGFPQDSENSAEDTDFNYKVVSIGGKIAREKNALVYWKIPKDLGSAIKKFYDYAKWDAKRGLMWHPVQKFRSHNIRAILKVIRYFIAIVLFLLGFTNRIYFLVLFMGFSAYIYWTYRKVYEEFGEVKTALWGIVIQFLTDFSVIAGFFSGLIEKVR